MYQIREMPLLSRRLGTHPADDIIIISEVRLALLAPKDLVGVEVYVVRETHDDQLVSSVCSNCHRCDVCKLEGDDRSSGQELYSTEAIT